MNRTPAHRPDDFPEDSVMPQRAVAGQHAHGSEDGTE